MRKATAVVFSGPYEPEELKSNRTVHIEANGKAAIPTGITLSIPEGLRGSIETVPDLFYRLGLVSQCTPVPDGEEIMVLVWNPQPHRVNIPKGMTLAHVRFDRPPEITWETAVAEAS